MAKPFESSARRKSSNDGRCGLRRVDGVKGSRANLISIKTKEAKAYRYRRRRDVSHRTLVRIQRYTIVCIRVCIYIYINRPVARAPPPCAFSTRFLLLVSLYYASPSLQYFQISAAMIFLPSPPPPPPTKQSVVRSHTHARAHILINTPTPVSSSSTHPFIGFFFFSFSLPFRFSKIESLSDTIRRGESKIEEEEEGEEAKEGNFSLAKLGFLFFFFLRGQQANRAERCWGGGEEGGRSFYTGLDIQTS